MSNAFTPNKVFYTFLAYMKPELSRSFRKKGDIYETYIPLEKAGHKFIFDPKESKITHLLYRPVFFGNGYEKKLDREVFLIEKTQKGFKVKKEEGLSDIAAA